MKPLLIAIGIVLAQGCSSIEQPESYYLSRQELVADNAIQHGWIPAWLPASAHAINEAHNLDTNEVWMKFEFDAAELQAIGFCRKDNTVTLRGARRPRLKHGSWWGKGEAGDWQGYICRWEQGGTARTAKMLVSKDRGVALYWEEGH